MPATRSRESVTRIRTKFWVYVQQEVCKTSPARSKTPARRDSVPPSTPMRYFCWAAAIQKEGGGAGGREGVDLACAGRSSEHNTSKNFPIRKTDGSQREETERGENPFDDLI